MKLSPLSQLVVKGLFLVQNSYLALHSAAFVFLITFGCDYEVETSCPAPTLALFLNLDYLLFFLSAVISVSSLGAWLAGKRKLSILFSVASLVLLNIILWQVTFPEMLEYFKNPANAYNPFNGFLFIPLATLAFVVFCRKQIIED
ncbi:MAG: hypothetical protein AAB701_02850 [Patescibacteria group bacterium]